jgi:hypothetical protein
VEGGFGEGADLAGHQCAVGKLLKSDTGNSEAAVFWTPASRIVPPLWLAGKGGFGGGALKGCWSAKCKTTASGCPTVFPLAETVEVDRGKFLLYSCRADVRLPIHFDEKIG